MRSFMVCILFVLGCSDVSDVQTPRRPFEPGDPGNGMYGSGSGPGGDTDPGGPPMCAESERRCARTFIYTGHNNQPLASNIKSVEMRGDYRPGAWMSGDPMTFDGTQYSVSVPVPWNTAVMYKFFITYTNNSTEWIADPRADGSGMDGNSVATAITCETWTCASSQIVCQGSAAVGDANDYDWRDAVMYFTFVDRFYNGDMSNDAPIGTLAGSGGDSRVLPPADWQGGDWAGISAKIDAGYFTSLGVNTLWITVPMDNAESAGLGTEENPHWYSGYHGYWPRDLTKTEARFGTSNDLHTLVTKAHAKGIKVIVDYAMNHVHADAPIYQQHQNDGWFNPKQVNGQDCVCGSAICGWDTATKECWFTNYLPDFNFNNADARAYSVNNLISWIKDYDLDGFRLDAIKHIELSWLQDVRSRLKSEVEATSKRHTYLVGETFTGDRGYIKTFVEPCTLLDGQFDFPLMYKVDEILLMRHGTMQDLRSFMDSNESFYGSAVMSTFIGNHDVVRAIGFATDTPEWYDIYSNRSPGHNDSGRDRSWMNQPAQPTDAKPYERVSVAMALLETNRGVPLIYYGDEVGLAGAGDPDNRRLMQWSGFLPGQSLLLDRMKKLGTFRAAHPALRRGGRTTLGIDNDSWLYKMVDGTDTVYVALNRSDSPKTLMGLPNGVALTDSLSGETITGPSVTIPARSARIMTP